MWWLWLVTLELCSDVYEGVEYACAIVAMDATMDKVDHVSYNYVDGDVEEMRHPCVRAKETSLMYTAGSISPSYPNAAAGISEHLNDDVRIECGTLHLLMVLHVCLQK